METTNLKWLEKDKFKIIKQIIIVSDRNNIETELGSILYTRPITKDYNFINQNAEDKQESNQINRLIQGYPKQKNYPIDDIDIIIFDAIRGTFPKSIVKNDSLLFNVDFDKLAVFKRKNVIKSVIYFFPEFSNIHNIYDYCGMEFKASKLVVNIYSYNKPKFLEDQIFYANYDAQSQTILENLNSVHFE